MRYSHLISALVLVLTVAIAVFPGPEDTETDARADYFEQDGFTFRIYNDWNGGRYLCVTGYAGSSEVVEIPTSASGYPVEGVGSGAFSGSATVREVIVPDSVDYIDDRAFENCGTLEKVNVPRHVSELKYSTFSLCKSLKEIAIESESLEGCSLSVGDARVVIDRDTVLKGDLTLCGSKFNAVITPDTMESVEADCLEVSVEPFTKEGLDTETLRLLGYADCYTARFTGLQDGCPVTMSLQVHFWYNDLHLHTVYKLSDGELVDIGLPSEGSHFTFQVDGPETVFFYGVKSSNTIPYSPVVGLAIAVAGTLAGLVYLLIHRRD